MTDWIDIAEKHGAKFVLRKDGKWVAESWRRGRPVPLFLVIGDSKPDVAQRFCQYIGVRGAGKLGDKKEVT